MKTKWLYITLIFALTMGVLALWDAPTQDITSEHKSIQSVSLPPYAIIADAHTQHFDQKGELSYQFVAKTLRHFRLNLSKISEGDYATLDSPQLTLYTQDGPWFITAETGKATENGAILTLWNNVRIWQNDNVTQQITELTTDKLIIEPLKKVVRTMSRVEITSPQGQLESIGMNINLLSKRIKLHSQVRGYHEPI